MWEPKLPLALNSARGNFGSHMLVLPRTRFKDVTKGSSRQVWLKGAMSTPTDKRKSQGQGTQTQHFKRCSCCQNRCVTKGSSRQVWLKGAMSTPTDKRKSQGQGTQTQHFKRCSCCHASGLKSGDASSPGRRLAAMACCMVGIVGCSSDS